MSRSLRREPTNANTWNDLGVVRLAADRPREALVAFSRALEINAAHTDALNNKAGALRRMKLFTEALPLQKRLVSLRPHSPDALVNLAESLYYTGNVAGAIEHYRTALWLSPDSLRGCVGLGEACESMGQFKQAHFQYLTVLRRDPTHDTALAKLLQLRGAAPDPTWAQQAQQLADDAATRGPSRVRLNNALAHYYDRRGQYDLAFQRLTRSAGEQARQRPFDSAGYSRAIDLLIETCTSDFFVTGRRKAVSRGPTALFIVGMPRSGTTLTEQILASHSQVVAGGEMSALPATSARVQALSRSKQAYPRGLAQLSAEQLEALASQYIQRLRAKCPDYSHKVTDKLPFNFMHLATAALLFPEARVIHCRRQPLDNCLSCYFTSFAEENPFANDLRALGRYYVDYDRLMLHWQQVLPLKIFELSYERMIAVTERTIGELLEFCGLPWEPSCLRFNETAREVRTPSRWQVRQPIYSQSVDRWRHYALPGRAQARIGSACGEQRYQHYSSGMTA